MMRFLTSSVAVLLLMSCSPKSLRGREQIPVTESVYTVKYFSDPAIDYVYKTSITIYGKSFGGILIAKKTATETHRIVFTTEFGNKLFDFELQDGNFKTNFILDELNRPIIIKTLQADFKLLFREKFAIDEQYSDGQNSILLSEDNNRRNILFVDKVSGNLTKLVHASKSKDKIILDYLAETTTFAAGVSISHRDIKLHIDLRRMD